MAVVRVTTKVPLGMPVKQMASLGSRSSLQTLVENHMYRQLHVELLDAGGLADERCSAVSGSGAQCMKQQGHTSAHAVSTQGMRGWTETWR